MSVPSKPARGRLTLLAAMLLVAVSLGAAASTASAASISVRELVPLLTRSGVGPDWSIIDVTYAPPIFFETTGIPVPEEMEAQETLAFILQETVHDGELPIEVAEAYLLLPGKTRVDPYDARVTAEDPHHRVSRLLFPRPLDWPDGLAATDGAPTLTLIVPKRDGSYSVANIYEWTVPIEIDA